MKALSDDKIVDSWTKNVDQWIGAIRNGEINSRVQITDRSILNIVLGTAPKTVLDLGCGEGWLVRALAKSGIKATGLDAVPGLIDAAISEGIGEFKLLPYADISYATLKEKYDVVVSNFSLLGEESVDNIFKKVPSILANEGYFIVQTLHPLIACGTKEYKDGWRQGTWEGFDEKFTDPAPWYFRTIGSWKTLYKTNGFAVERIEEPISEEDGTIASIVFVGRKMN